MGLFSKKSAPQPSARPEYIEVGQIVNTHGVRGEVKVQPWDVSPELLCGFKTFYMDGAPFRPTSKRVQGDMVLICLLYTSPSPRDTERSRMPSSA